MTQLTPPLSTQFAVFCSALAESCSPCSVKSRAQPASTLSWVPPQLTVPVIFAVCLPEQPGLCRPFHLLFPKPKPNACVLLAQTPLMSHERMKNRQACMKRCMKLEQCCPVFFFFWKYDYCNNKQEKNLQSFTFYYSKITNKDYRIQNIVQIFLYSCGM